MSRQKLIVLAMAGLLLGGLALRLSYIRGLVRAVRIVSGSMAPAWPGTHYESACTDCRFPVRYGAELVPGDGRLTCPNCGSELAMADDATAREGSRVLIDAWPLLLREPRRWEVVALQRAERDQSQQWAIKRVVGLPEELVAIRDGDLYINDAILRKSLAQQRQVAQLVYDDRYRPNRTSGLRERWQADRADSGWTAQPDGYAYREQVQEARSATKDPAAPLVWITYRHWRSFRHPAPRTDEVPVLDAYGYNQSLSRELHEVGDLMLVCDVDCGTGPGQLGIRITDGREQFDVRLNFATGQMRLSRGSNQVVAKARLPEGFQKRPFRLEAAACDRQLLVAINDHLLIRYRYGQSQRPFQPTSRPLSLGAAGASIRISGIRIYRDIYYLDPRGLGKPWQLGKALEKNEFLVLGDNVPVSEDSRHWSSQLSRKALLGVVLDREHR